MKFGLVLRMKNEGLLNMDKNQTSNLHTTRVVSIVVNLHILVSIPTRASDKVLAF